MFVHKYARPSSLSAQTRIYIKPESQSSIFNNLLQNAPNNISFDSWIKANKNNQQS